MSDMLPRFALDPDALVAEGARQPTDQRRGRDDLNATMQQGFPANHLASIRKAAGARAGLIWLTMLYRCDGCGQQSRVAAEVGVEGPPDLRERGSFVASPYSFRCGACQGLVSHVEFGKDEEFEPRPRRGEWCFALPDDTPDLGARLDRGEENYG